MIRPVLHVHQSVSVPQTVAAFSARAVISKVDDHIVVRSLCNPMDARTLGKCRVLSAAGNIRCLFCLRLYIVGKDIQGVCSISCAAPHGLAFPVNREVGFVRQHDHFILTKPVYQRRLDSPSLNGAFH